MVEKVARYAILSFFSFLFFTLVFHAAASTSNASQGFISPEVTIAPTESVPLPTPTIFVYEAPTVTPSNISITPVPKASSPHVLTTQINPTATPTPTAQPTAVPTITPTATIAPTSAPTETPALTPTLQPTVSVTTVGTDDLETLFTTYSTAYHVDKTLLEKIAQCESGKNSNALNGDYTGMFQFATSSWISVRATMGLDTNPDLRKNAEEAIRTAAYMISQGRASAWPTCSR
jgi:hypothetical protein